MGYQQNKNWKIEYENWEFDIEKMCEWNGKFQL